MLSGAWVKLISPSCLVYRRKFIYIPYKSFLFSRSVTAAQWSTYTKKLYQNNGLLAPIGSNTPNSIQTDLS